MNNTKITANSVSLKKCLPTATRAKAIAPVNKLAITRPICRVTPRGNNNANIIVKAAVAVCPEANEQSSKHLPTSNIEVYGSTPPKSKTQEGRGRCSRYFKANSAKKPGPTNAVKAMYSEKG
jgi:hypothetical protein